MSCTPNRCCNHVIYGMWTLAGGASETVRCCNCGEAHSTTADRDVCPPDDKNIPTKMRRKHGQFRPKEERA